MNRLTEFGWYRHPNGYEIKRYGELEGPWKNLLEGSQKKFSMHEDGPWIVPKGNPANFLSYRPFARRGYIADEFVRVSTPLELLSFINAHGPLTAVCVPGDGNSVMAWPGEHLPDGLVHAEKLREVLKIKAAGDLKKLAVHFQANIASFVGDGLVWRAELVADSQSGLRVQLMPRTLLGALWYEFWRRKFAPVDTVARTGTSTAPPNPDRV